MAKNKGRYPKLKTSQFGLPKKRKYPINTKKRARSALSYISRYGTSAQKHTVRSRVHKRYPKIHVSGLRH